MNVAGFYFDPQQIRSAWFPQGMIRRVVCCFGRGAGKRGLLLLLLHFALAAHLLAEDRSTTNSLGMVFVPVPGTDIRMSVYETRVGDYRTFVEATGCEWEPPTFVQTDDHPAVNVTWDDAKAFCAWLGEKDGRIYRLPTDHEWSCAAGIGASEDPAAGPRALGDGNLADFPWGTAWPPPRGAGNYADTSIDPSRAMTGTIAGYEDGFAFTAPGGSFAANRLGIHDLGGNAAEWCEDLFAPNDAGRVLRGGSWNESARERLLSSHRHRMIPAYRNDFIGFRVVLEN